MAIKFTTPKQFKTSTGTALLKQLNRYSVSFFYRYELDYAPSVSNLCAIVGRQYCADHIHGGGSTNVRHSLGVQNNNAQNASTIYELAPGTTYHLAWIYDQGHQYVFVNGVQAADFGTLTGISRNTGGYFYLGGVESACSFSLDDLCVWHDYVLTPADVIAIRGSGTGGVDPTTIGASATNRYRWKLRGTVGQVVSAGGSGLLDDFGHTDSHFSTESTGSTGSAVYVQPLFWAPAAATTKAVVSTSGKMFFFDLISKATGLGVTATTITANPSFSINGGPFVACDPNRIWNTGIHNRIGYALPAGTVLNPSDKLKIKAPVGWANTSIGLADAIDLTATNCTGRSSFGNEAVPRTMRLGIGVTPYTNGNTNWMICKNQRLRVGSYQGTRDANGRPVTIVGLKEKQFSQSFNFTYGNGIDATQYPGQVGYFAVGWDDLNNANPTNLRITDPNAGSGNADYTITALPAYNNPGTVVGNTTVGIVRVYRVQRTATATSAQVDLSLSFGTTTPEFANDVIYGPGDFTLGTPTVLDKSDPFALSPSLLDRISGAGSLRFMETTLGIAGYCPASEPEHLRQLNEWSWGEGYEHQTTPFGISQVRNLDVTRSPYIYSPCAGTKFTATLASAINSSQTTITISDAATAPVFAGLRLFIDSEILRVESVNGTTVTVKRGMERTVPASHAAGAIQVGYRMPTPTDFTKFESKGQIVEFVTTTPHLLRSGARVNYTTSNSWPTFTFSDGSTSTIIYFTDNTWVTGPNSFACHNYSGSSSTCVTINPASPYNLDSAQCMAWFVHGSAETIPREITARIVSSQPNCDMWVNVPHGFTNDLAIDIFRRIRDNLTPGRNVWVELSNEVWNAGGLFTQYRYFRVMSSLLNNTIDPYFHLIDRSAQLWELARSVFNENGLNRGGEIKGTMNIQTGQAGKAQWVLNYAKNKTPALKIDAIADAPYVAMPSYIKYDTVSAQLARNLDTDAQIDLYIHHLVHGTAVDAFPVTWQGIIAAIDDYNNATGFRCVHNFYEGGIELSWAAYTGTGKLGVTNNSTAVVGTGTRFLFEVQAGDKINIVDSSSTTRSYTVASVTDDTHLSLTASYAGATETDRTFGVDYPYQKERARDFYYHPNFYIAEQDWYALQQLNRVTRTNPFNIGQQWHEGRYLWGFYHGIQQQAGRGDGSDGKADNRLTLALPGRPNSKSATTNQDLMNVSVRGQAWLDWNKACGATNKPKRLPLGGRWRGRP